MNVIRQEAPSDASLRRIVEAVAYRPGWSMRLTKPDFVRDPGCVGTTFVVLTHGHNAYHQEDDDYGVLHYFPVPAATYDDASWTRWVLDRLLEVETHEACEFLTVDGHRPFAPVHAPGHNPYTVRELATDEDRRTSFRGEVKA